MGGGKAAFGTSFASPGGVVLFRKGTTQGIVLWKTTPKLRNKKCRGLATGSLADKRKETEGGRGKEGNRGMETG